MLAIRSLKTGSVKFSPAIVESGTPSSSSSATEATPPIRSSLKRSSLRSSGTVSAESISEISSFRDGSLRTGVFLCGLLDAVQPGCVNWKLITPAASIDINTPAGVEACEANARLVSFDWCVSG